MANAKYQENTEDRALLSLRAVGRRGVTFETGLGRGEGNGSGGPNSDRGSGWRPGAHGKGLCIWMVESSLVWLEHRWEMTLGKGTLEPILKSLLQTIK